MWTQGGLCSHPGLGASGIGTTGVQPPSWCAGVQSANGVVCFGLLTLLWSVVLVEKSSRGHLCFRWRGGFRAVPTCPRYFLGDPPSLWTNGV